MRSDTSHVLGKLQGDDAQYMYSPKSLALVYMRNMCSLRVPEEAPKTEPRSPPVSVPADTA